MVSEVTDEVQTDFSVMPEIERLIQDFSDVILEGDDLPPGLPPERPNLPQAILLEPGSKPWRGLCTGSANLKGAKARGRLGSVLSLVGLNPPPPLGLHQCSL